MTEVDNFLELADRTSSKRKAAESSENESPSESERSLARDPSPEDNDDSDKEDSADSDDDNQNGGTGAQRASTSQWTEQQRYQAFALLGVDEIDKLVKKAGLKVTRRTVVTMIPSHTKKLAACHQVEVPKKLSLKVIGNMRYSGMSMDELCRLSTRQLENEVLRLLIKAPSRLVLEKKGRSRWEISELYADLLLKYTNSTPTKKYKPYQRQDARNTDANRNSLLKQAIEHSVPMAHRLSKVDLQLAIKKGSEREVKRSKLPVDRRMRQIIIPTKGKQLVILNCRHSSNAEPEKRKSDIEQFGAIQQALHQGQIMANLESAQYMNCIWTATRLGDPLPLTTFDLRNEYKIAFLENIEKMPKGSAVILVLLGLEGLTANQEGLRAFVRQYQHLEFTLLIGETREQWISREVVWSNHDWSEPILERYWAAVNLKMFLADKDCCRLYSNLAAQWVLCLRRRRDTGAAMALEGRRTTGRNGKKAKK